MAVGRRWYSDRVSIHLNPEHIYILIVLDFSISASTSLTRTSFLLFIRSRAHNRPVTMAEMLDKFCLF